MSLPKRFEIYLKTERNVSGKTLRNYRADLLHFSNWSKGYMGANGTTVDGIDSLLSFMTQDMVEAYKSDCLSLNTPQSTLNRRLSTIRNFSKFLISEGLISHNPTERLENAKESLPWEKQKELILADFAKALTHEGVSRTTQKNYLSDIRQFLTWVPGQAAQVNELNLKN